MTHTLHLLLRRTPRKIGPCTSACARTSNSSTPVQSHIAAARELQADVTIFLEQSCAAAVWITVQHNGSSTTTGVSLWPSPAAPCLQEITPCACLFSSHADTCVSAPGSYVITTSILQQQQQQQAAASSLSFSATVHDTLPVRGCPPCGTVLAYTCN